MLTYWETLTAIQSNIAVNDSYAQLWGKKSQSGYTVETYTGTLPATLQTVEGYLESYKIYGNTVQNGTPTPENPIVPSGCGELETTGAHAGQYKLSLTSAGQNVDIYLGEVETTRRIKKLMLTGEENITMPTASSFQIFGVIQWGSTSGFCTHYQQITWDEVTYVSKDGFAMRASSGRAIRFRICDRSITTVADFKTYLAAQYANGTPVTVWYVLTEPETEPETGIVNEPLMKIGNYADTIDSTQTTVQIPTAAGTTIIDYAGEGLAPSEVELVYKVKR